MNVFARVSGWIGVMLTLVSTGITSAEAAAPAAGVFNFSAAEYRATDWESVQWRGDEVPGTIITVTRTVGSAGRVLVDYSTDDNGTIAYDPTNGATRASPGSDYCPAHGTLVFDDYQMSASFIIQPNENPQITGPKFLPIFLSNSRCAPEEDPSQIVPVIGTQSTAILTIAQVLVSANRFAFQRAVARVRESSGSVSVNIMLVSGVSGSVRVISSNPAAFLLQAGSDYAESSPWNSNNGGDFVAVDQVVTIPAGDWMTTLQVIIRDDLKPEFNEDIRLHLEALRGQPPINPLASEMTITIVDDDQAAGVADRDWNPDNVTFTEPPLNSAPGANDLVNAVVVAPDGKALIAGAFTGYNATSRSGIARLNADGSLDQSFNPGAGADGPINALALDRTPANYGKILIGGGFANYAGESRNGVARINADGTLDSTFQSGAGANAPLRALVPLDSGKLLVAGDFTQFSGVPRNGLSRLNPDGSVDLGYNAGRGPNGRIWALAQTGSSTTFQVVGGPGEYRTNVFLPSSAGIISGVFSTLCVPDSLRIYNEDALIFDTGLTNDYAGDPTCHESNYTGGIHFVIPYELPERTLTLVVNEGTADPSTIWLLDVSIDPIDSGAYLYAVGEFTSFGNFARNGIVRLYSSGGVDTSFNPGLGADGPVYSIALQPDGKILIGGAFQHFDSFARKGIARLNSDGTVDRTFDPGDGANDSVYAIALQSDGKFLIGGIFTEFDHVRRKGIARLQLDGSLDTSFMDTAYNQFAGLTGPFSFGPPGMVQSIAVETDGNILIGGWFSTVGGHHHSSLATNWSTAWTRQDKIPRLNVARLIGGSTPGPGGIEFAQPDYQVSENQGTLNTTVRRVGGRLGQIEANVTTLDRSAASGADYTATQLSALWPQGSAPGPISFGSTNDIEVQVPILNDSQVEPDESFVFEVGVPTGSIVLGGEYIPLGAARTRSAFPATILDDDGGKLSVRAPDQNGVVLMSLVGRPAESIAIEASTNLINWDRLFLITNSSGTVTFTDQGATNSPQRFYRARLTP